MKSETQFSLEAQWSLQEDNNSWDKSLKIIWIESGWIHTYVIHTYLERLEWLDVCTIN